MLEFDHEIACDILVVGGGCAGISAAAAAAQSGAKTLLVDAGAMLGGELISGMPLIGAVTMTNRWVVGGMLKQLLDICQEFGGYIGPVSDFRTLNVVAFDSEIMKIAVAEFLHRSGVEILLYTLADRIETRHGRVTGVVLRNKSGRSLVRPRAVIDCSGDGDVAISAGAPYESGDAATGAFQALTLMFRMVNVDADAFLRFIASQPDDFDLRHQPALGMTREQCIAALVRQGLPKAAMMATGLTLKRAIASGEMFPVSALAIAPVSRERREVSINATRIANIDATDTQRLSGTIRDLMLQVRSCSAFLKRSVPGFENAHFSGLAPRVGIRETKRVIGEHQLSRDDVLGSHRFDDVIGLGSHELDVHGAGTDHLREVIPGAGTYDVPFRCLIPKGLSNVLIAGRCISSTREGHSSARVMGTCMATGQAAGTAAAYLAGEANIDDVRLIPIEELQRRLAAAGAVLN
ncbi:FAD-dependent oxidoreductase [Bradyrhizobium manausense]|nr:FAD-dependent oxidoreductase [Bradyrhizobium manausense]